MKNNKIKISVRNLVQFVLKKGDLKETFLGMSRAVEGTRAHQRIQRSSGETYKAEVSLIYNFIYKEIDIEIQGRADGIIEEDEYVIIDEIKTTTVPLLFIEEDHNILHWAQGKCYAYMYAKENGLKDITVQLTYYSLETKEIKRFQKEFILEQLEEFFFNLIEEYLKWAIRIRDWNTLRDVSIKELNFPFNSYRQGQRELSVAVYRTIKEEKKLFLQAPTGIGKTVGTLFPSLKALAEGLCSKIFYLTAKTITRGVAENSISSMRNQGLRLKTLTITAKDKICFKEERNCDSENCEYAKNYYDKVKKALEEILNFDNLNRECIETCAKKYEVCPFELSLDLCAWVDSVICDYNYIFDPRVSLKRIFEEQGDLVILVDEAHNLVDRSREMFSSELSKATVMELKKKTKEIVPGLSKTLGKLNSFMIKKKKQSEDLEGGILMTKDSPEEIYPILRKFIKEAEVWLLSKEEDELKEDVLGFYFEVLSFLRVGEVYDDNYVTYYEDYRDDFKTKLFCLDPSLLLNKAMEISKATVLFSATLNPLEYFMKILGGEEDSYKLRLTSPFPMENLCLIVHHGIQTRYKYRGYSYNRISEVIYETIKGCKGNYLVFFPSYKYMEEVYNVFLLLNEGQETEIIMQTSDMDDSAKKGFLERFSFNNRSLVAFAVMGGVFGEGIDLVGDKLSGAIIVGVGLPQVCEERNIIQHHFQIKRNAGFNYAYVYPGMNKVMQAVGRVIRTEKDRGAVVLIDTRFKENEYRKLFPEEWNQAVFIKDYKEIGKVLDEFWKSKD